MTALSLQRQHHLANSHLPQQQQPPHPAESSSPARGATRHHQASSSSAHRQLHNSSQEPQRSPQSSSGAMPSAEDENGEGSSGPDRLGNPQRPRIPHGRSSSASFSRRPSSAPGNNQQQGPSSTQSDDEAERPLVVKKTKPPLLRSQSEYAGSHRQQEDTDHSEQEQYEWGARHGFEDHYQSEDIISQLANVSWAFFAVLLCFISLVFGFQPCRKL